MPSALIGALRVTLGLDTAAFEKGADDVTRRSRKMTREIKALGKKWQGVGKGLSAAITVPVLGAAAAFSKMGHDMAREAKEMRIAAQVAGEGFEEFQRQAYAARSVGVEFDKLGDIFKDVRDRVGDFVQTGGGPMADFFENIAPKVGVTAKQFEKLGGKDALQLYYDSLVKAGVSQEDMVFYLEAMASDTTALIPLLQKGGKAFDQLGGKAAIISEKDAADMKAYTDAQLGMENAMRKLTIAIAQSGVLELVTELAQNVAGFVERLSQASPQALRFAVAAGAIAAALGPVAFGIGSIIKLGAPLIAVFKILGGVGPLATLIKAAGFAVGFLSKSLLLLLTNPVILGAAVVIGGIYLAWKNWDKIKPVIDRVGAAISGWWNGTAAPVLKAVGIAVFGTITAFQRLYQGARQWLQDKLGAVFNWLGNRIEDVKGFFHDMYMSVVGNSDVPDMVEEIAAEMRKLDSGMVGQAQSATAKTRQAFAGMARDVRSLLDDLFPKAAQLRQYRDNLDLIARGRAGGVLSGVQADEAQRRLLRRLSDAATGDLEVAGLGQGPLVAASDITRNIEQVEQSIDGLGKKTNVQTVRIADSFRDMAEKSVQALQNMASAIKGGGFLDILGGAVNLFLQLGSTGLFGKGLAANINRVPAYAGGTNFHPGGLALVGERGPELVNMPRGSKVHTNSETRGMLGGGGTLEIIPSPYFDVRVDGRIQGASGSIMDGSAQLTTSRLSRRQTRRIG